jgi:hypothetical protein
MMGTVKQAVAAVDKEETQKEAENTPTLGDWLEEFKEKRRKHKWNPPPVRRVQPLSGFGRSIDFTANKRRRATALPSLLIILHCRPG